jgi:hypothetical protein
MKCYAGKRCFGSKDHEWLGCKKGTEIQKFSTSVLLGEPARIAYEDLGDRMVNGFRPRKP